MELDQDFSESVASSLANDVGFLTVEGYVLAAHGASRYTSDLDT